MELFENFMKEISLALFLFSLMYYLAVKYQIKMEESPDKTRKILLLQAVASTAMAYFVIVIRDIYFKGF